MMTKDGLIFEANSLKQGRLQALTRQQLQAQATQNRERRWGAMGISWSLGLTGEAGYLVALLAGLFVGNVVPRVAAGLKAAARPEWFIKTAIVILGAGLGVKAAGASGLVTAIMFRGLAAIIEAYLIYWALVYLLARSVFRFSREWAAPLASGISICGVSAAITTGAAIRARPVVPIMVSSLVVVFSVVELLILPLAAERFLWGSAPGRGGLDGPGRQDRRRRRGQWGDHRLLDPRPRPAGGHLL